MCDNMSLRTLPYQIRNNSKLTVEYVSQALNRWKNKQEKKDIQQQSNFILTQALQLIFNTLKEIFENVKVIYKFEIVVGIYINLFQSTGNNQHRYLVQQHLKELLEPKNYEKYKLQKKYYEFLCRIFSYYPYLVFRQLQSRYQYIFGLQEYEEVIKLYDFYIKFGNTRKNQKLLEQYIRREVNANIESLDKLKILLTSYNNSYKKIINQITLKQILKIIGQKNARWNNQKQLNRLKILNFCETLFNIDWPQSMIAYKTRTMLQMIKIWESNTNITDKQKKSINKILVSLEIRSQQVNQLKIAIKKKISQNSQSHTNFALNCQFAKIILSKFTKTQSQQVLTKQQYQDMINQILQSKYDIQQKIQLLDVVRSKQIYNLNTEIGQYLLKIISSRINNEQSSWGQICETERISQVIFALKIFRYYKFQIKKIHNLFKQFILRCNKMKRPCHMQLRKQILLVCLHILQRQQFTTAQDEKRAFRDIVDLVKQQIQLKIMMIQFIVDNLNDRFYNQKSLYSVYRQNKYEQLLYQDYATNDMIIKIFSIKTICYLADDPHSQYTFFLKNAYYQIYDRLSIKYLIGSQEKETCLKIIREIMRHRAELFQNQAIDLAVLLLNQLQKSIQFHSPHTNNISIYILKIFQALMKKIPHKIIDYIRPLGYYIINIINFKIIKKQLKRRALQTFCEMIQNCNYVILPYFHFSNLYFILRQILRSDDHYYYYQTELLRLIGRLGYVNQEQFVGLQVLCSSNAKINHNFQEIFKEIGYIKQLKEKEKKEKETDKKQPTFEVKPMVIEDAFYSQQKNTSSCIQIQNYRYHILYKIMKNVSPGCLQINLNKTLRTIFNIIPVLTQQQHQKWLHSLLLERIFEIEPRYSNEVLNIMLQLLKHHELGDRCKDILNFYLNKIYNNKRELDLVKMLCVLTSRYNECFDINEDIVAVIIVAKKIILQNIEVADQEYKVKLCFSIIANLADKIDSILHLFFIDINKIFSRSQDREDKMTNSRTQISKSISTQYFALLIRLTKACPSIQYFLPSIRQCLIGYFNLQISRKEENRQFLYKIINTMICMMVIYGRRCETFINILQESIKSKNIFHMFYNISQEYFKKNSNLDYLHCAFTPEQEHELFYYQITTFTFQKPKLDTKNYREERYKIIRQIQKLNIQRNLTEEQQDLWLDNLTIQLFTNSTQQILRACSELVTYDKVFSYDLFDVPFYFFWISLTNQEKNNLTVKLKNILMRRDITLRIRQKLLDTVYFIERCNIPLLIKDKILSDASVQVQDQVKALFYLQREFETDPETYRQALIQKYSQIGQQQSALGILNTILKTIIYSKKQSQVWIKRLYFKIFRNLGIFEEVEQKKQSDILHIQLRQDIFDWQSVNNMINKEITKPSVSKSKYAHLALEASINLGKWDQFKNWISFLDEEHKNQQTNLWTAMFLIYQKKYEQAEKLINDIRDKIYYKIRQMFNFSYQKSMKGVLILQQICEVEQILQFRKYIKSKQYQQSYDSDQISNRKKQLVNLWNDRLEGVKNNLYSMQKILFVRSLLLSKSQDIDNWIIFCKLALKENISKLGKNTLKKLKQLNINDQMKKLQLLFIEKEIDIADMMIKSDEALSQIEKITGALLTQKKYSKLIFQIYYKYAQNIIDDDDFTLDKGNNLISILSKFVFYNDYYELQHMMGLTHIKILQIITEEEKKKGKSDRKMTTLIKEGDQGESFSRRQKQQKSVQKSIKQALCCFLKSVTNCKSSTQNNFFLEDCLKILNLISMGNNTSQLIKQLNKQYRNIPSQGLIQIIPQIIARLDNNIDQNIGLVNIMRDLLIYIGADHPQALLFPIIFLRKGNNQFKKSLAVSISQQISLQNEQFKHLYDNGEMIVDELCRISLKLSEKVFIFMSRIIKMMEDQKNINRISMACKIINFCQKILQETQKLSSQSQFGFIQKQKQNLILIIQYLSIYKQLDEIYYFKQSQKIIRCIVKETIQNLNFIKVIYLQEASVKLFNIKKSNVCLFGTYSPNGGNVMIDRFKNQLRIINSKQRPKKLVIIGTDNKEYNYLLKGKQDLRLDERIMQLFSFINKLFHSPSQKQKYSIQGYSITPINFQIGIISWVQNCDNIGDLIIRYRRSNGVSEKKLMLQVDLCKQICPSFTSLSKYHKVQIFREVQRLISGQDLKNIFWKRSVTSQKWLKNRSCFTRSLAVMSIVGYIIGLGDRHPFNIMVQRDTGKIVHIDFGDCFQVTRNRKSYPEKVPFRLTRMLVNAMGPCKTVGIFKQTCEKTMKILRKYKQSILVIIEAFRYDPLIGWTIFKGGDKGDEMMLEHMEIDDLNQSLQEDKKKTGLRSNQKRKESQSTKVILNNIKDKLHGKQSSDNSDKKPLLEADQVDRLIKEATSAQNLVQHWQKWCIFW